MKPIPVEPEVVSSHRWAPERVTQSAVWVVRVVEKLANGTERTRLERYTTKQAALRRTRGGDP